MDHQAISLRAAIGVFVTTRVLCFAVAALAAALLGHDLSNEATFDVGGLTHPFGDPADSVLAPLAAWDAVWYLGIGLEGYGSESGLGTDAAFFPLYPLLARGVGELLGLGLTPASLLAGAYAVSLASLAGALYLFHRLVELELGRALALPALLLLALFPAAFFLGAPYSESLFLLLSIGTFYAARTNHWAWAGIAAALASATRSAGILLLIPLALFYISSRAQGSESQDEKAGNDGEGPGRRRQPQTFLARVARGKLSGRATARHERFTGDRTRAPARWSWAWLLLAPLGLAGFTIYLGLAHGDPFAYLDAQTSWYRDFAGPFGAIPDAIVAAFDGARQLLSGSRSPVYYEPAGGDPFEVARHNLTLFGFLVFALVALIGTLRRLPLPYGAYALAALALPLSFPVEPQPLMSLPRFLCVLFPLFMWLALWCSERRLTAPVLALSTVLLVLFTAQFATWQWVA